MQIILSCKISFKHTKKWWPDVYINGKARQSYSQNERGLQPKGTWLQTSNSRNSYNGLFAFPKVRMDGHNLFHQMAESDQNKRMVPYKEDEGSLFRQAAYTILHAAAYPQTEQEWFYAVATGCAAPSTMLLLKAQSSDWARIIPALYTQAARSSMLLFNVQSSDWVRIIPLHKVACYITKKELPGLYSSQNITKGGRSSWLVC